MPRPLLLAWALALGGCFTGGFLSGQPCAADADCGPSLRCEAGVCGGPSGQATTTAASSSTAVPTTDASATGIAPTTTAPTTTTTGASSTGEDPSTGGGCGLGRCQDLDILFVADNSPSMLLKTLILLDFISTFASELIPEIRTACSVHLGVVTTDVYARNPIACQGLGALVQADNDGDPCMYIEGLPYATLPDLDTPLGLECMFNTGADGSGDEQPIDALFSAVGATNVGLDPGCNAGFYRPGAFLTVIMVTDEDDDNNDAQGNDGSEDLLEQVWSSTFSNLKGSGYDDIYVVGLLGDADPFNTTCPWMPLESDDGIGAESAPKLRGFIQSVPADHHAIGTLCGIVPNGNNYLPLMDEIRTEIHAACGA